MIYISQPFIGREEKEAVLAVMDSGMIAQSSRTAEFERKFAEYCGTRHAIATSSGTTALHVALMAHEVGPGDEVITTPFTFIASPNSILYTGAKPVFVDIEEDTFNIDPEQVAQAITPKTKAIMPVHLYGQVCNMTALEKLAADHGLALVEDAAQSVGATYKGKRAGSFGTGVFSLYATKNVMSAEGGMITTDDDELAEKCRLLRNHGMKRRYHYEMLGYNYRMTDIHAAIGLAQMERLPWFLEQRRAHADYLNQHLSSVLAPHVSPECEHVWHQYTVRLTGGRDRDAAVKQLAEAGVGSGVFYPIPAHIHGYMREIVGDLHFPVAERLAEEVISLPVHPRLSEDDLDKIVTEVNKL